MKKLLLLLFLFVSSILSAQELVNTMHVFMAVQNQHYFPVYIDWSKLPDIGFPKDEITSIEVLHRTAIQLDKATTIFTPNKWRFSTDLISYEYKGRIPYLEDFMTFTTNNTETNISLSIQSTFTQNSLGYFMDSNNKFGIYAKINGSSPKAINKLILPSLENVENNIFEKALVNKTIPSLETTSSMITNIEVSIIEEVPMITLIEPAPSRVSVDLTNTKNTIPTPTRKTNNSTKTGGISDSYLDTSVQKRNNQ